MSDEKLRELERRWRESGTVEDEAVYLRERVRVGDLSQERLEVAGFVGDEASRLALGSAWREPDEPRDSAQLAEALATWGDEVYFRGAVAAYVDLALPALRKRFASSWVPNNILNDGFELTARWVEEWIVAQHKPLPTLRLDRMKQDIQKIRNAVRSEVVPWALGYFDPVRMRVAKRGEAEICLEDDNQQGRVDQVPEDR